MYMRCVLTFNHEVVSTPFNQALVLVSCRSSSRAPWDNYAHPDFSQFWDQLVPLRPALVYVVYTSCIYRVHMNICTRNIHDMYTTYTKKPSRVYSFSVAPLL